MTVRLLILLMLAGGLAAYLVTRATAPPAPTCHEQAFLPGDDDLTLEQIRSKAQGNLSDYDFDCDAPPEPPAFEFDVRVRPGDPKHRLYFDVRETHGCFVAYLNIAFFYKPEPDSSIDASPLIVPHTVPTFLVERRTLTSCIEVVDRELKMIGGQIGTSENWGAEMTSIGRACRQAPDPLPPVSDLPACE